jgi:DNA-binding NtrC family response regulator
MTVNVLIAEDEEITLKHLVGTLQREGYGVTGTTNGLDALQRIEADTFDLLIADIKMPGMTGIELLEKVKERSPETDVIIITGFGSIGSAIEAMKKGAMEYVTKPFDLDELVLKVRKLNDRKALIRENIALKTYLGMDKKVSIIARSSSMRRILATIEGMRNSDSNILLTGETGVGKSLLAKIIHFTSTRQERPFLSINCATLTEELLASELFGHERGAFTGAIRTKQGLMEIADTGTLFLDEIAEMAPNLQAKLLKVIEEREFFRVGGTRPHHVDVRFIAATNEEPRSAVDSGRFRKDLYYRLNVVDIFIPPLRERREDIVPLANYFLQKHLPKSHKKITGFAKDATEVLMRYAFPGNVRELENAVERAIILEKTSHISPEGLPLDVKLAQIDALVPGKLRTIEELNKEYAERVIEMFGGNRTKAAEVLGISRTSLWRILKEE